MEEQRLTDEERQALFNAALATENGQKLQSYLWAMGVLLERDRELVDTIAEGVIDSPDHGNAMATAQWEELGEDERRGVNEAVRKLLRRALAESVSQLEDASGRLGVDPHEIEPETVALLAASSVVIKGHRYEGEPEL
jgi:hypothetical protein